MAKSDITKFWKLLADAKYTGNPSSLTEEDLWRMIEAAKIVEPEIEAVLRGFRELKKIGF